jgi:hypothetical protein
MFDYSVYKAPTISESWPSSLPIYLPLAEFSLSASRRTNSYPELSLSELLKPPQVSLPRPLLLKSETRSHYKRGALRAHPLSPTLIDFHLITFNGCLVQIRSRSLACQPFKSTSPTTCTKAWLGIKILTNI